MASDACPRSLRLPDRPINDAIVLQPIDLANAQGGQVFELTDDGDYNAIDAGQSAVLPHETFCLRWPVRAGDEGFECRVEGPPSLHGRSRRPGLLVCTFSLVSLSLLAVNTIAKRSVPVIVPAQRSQLLLG